METYYGSMYCFAPGGTAVPAINPGNASVPGRPREHASAAEYLQRDIANSNSNLHSNNIHCIILYYSSIELIQLWFLTWCVGLSQLCSVFDQLCYSIMLHFLINYASKCTNYASYMTNYSHIKIVNFIRFSSKMQCKTKEENLTSNQ